MCAGDTKQKKSGNPEINPLTVVFSPSKFEHYNILIKKIVKIQDCKKVHSNHNDVAYDFLFQLINIVSMETNQECMNMIII